MIKIDDNVIKRECGICNHISYPQKISSAGMAEDIGYSVFFAVSVPASQRGA